MTEAGAPTYTVFIRLPFPRGEFVDPPAVNWDSTKDNALWKILSKASKNSDIDWNDLFDVSLPFLLQQAAWLYERQFQRVRAQMRKAGAAKPASPVPGSDSTNGESMRRTGSGGGVPRVPSAVSIRREIPRSDNSLPTTPIIGGDSLSYRPNSTNDPAAPLSRTSSASTTVPTRQFLQISPRLAKASLQKRSNSPAVRPPNKSLSPSSPSSTISSSSSSSSSSESELPARSRLLRRPPRYTAKKGRSDDEDDAPFLPFSNTADAGPGHDPSATLRGDPKGISKRIPLKTPEEAEKSQTSDSSASSTAHRPKPKEGDVMGRRPTGPLSPRRTAELAGRGKLGREGSDGSPSMGSSFSDLDDASVTQSALEEALASKMQAGGMASKMSTISQALKSRYL